MGLLNSLLVTIAAAPHSRRQLWPSPDADCSTFPSESYPDCASIDTQHDHSASECELKSCKWCVFDENTGDGPDGGGTCIGNPAYTQFGSGSGSGSYFTKEPGYSDGYASGSGYGDGSYHDYDHNYPHDSPGPYGDGYARARATAPPTTRTTRPTRRRLPARLAGLGHGLPPAGGGRLDPT